jgi:hypothetical protein
MTRPRNISLLIGASLVLIVATVALAASGKGELTELKQATAGYHNVDQAVDNEYEAFLDCFESPDGGMGQHYVNMELLNNPAVDPLRPEALVYEVGKDGKLKLVAVEWIVPGIGNALETPRVYGRDFHYNQDLGVWVLHAWIWSNNPSGTFEDWNPKVGTCPAPTAEVGVWLP